MASLIARFPHNLKDTLQLPQIDMETSTHHPGGSLQNGGKAMDPMHLETLGKQAARLSESGEMSLTDAVVNTIGREKLNSEQVRRVVEQANIEAYNRKFASLTGSTRAVHIDGGPADPVAVLQSLNDGARPREVTIDSLEYSMPPESAKTSSFSFVTSDRTAGGVHGDVYSMHQQLSGAHDELVQNIEASRCVMNESLVELAGLVKSASLQGATSGEIFEAWARRDVELAKVAFERLRSFMNHQNVKVAGRRLNPESTVIHTFELFAKSAHDLETNTAALRNLEHELRKVSSWLKVKRSAA